MTQLTINGKECLLVAFLFLLIGCKEKKTARPPATKIDSLVHKSVISEVDSLARMIREKLDTYSNYAEAKMKQDSIQILILQTNHPSKRLIKQFYYWDSVRVYYAKIGIKQQTK